MESTSQDLKSKLEEIERLEKEHGIAGVKVLAGHALATNDCVANGLALMKRGAELVKQEGDVPPVEGV